MKNRRVFRIIVMIACFLFAGLNLLRISQGAYTGMDVFLMVVFLAFGVIYAYLLLRKEQDR